LRFHSGIMGQSDVPGKRIILPQDRPTSWFP
jgi:hypothetical protein